MLKRSSWMSGKAGIMIHYLPPCAEGPNGEKYTSVDDSVNSFDILEVAAKTANFLSDSKRSQILQNGSSLQFNGKVPRRTVLR